MIFLKTLIGCVNEGAAFPSCIRWIKDGRRGDFQFLEAVFRSAQAFRISQFQFRGSDAGTEDEGTHEGTVSDSMNLR